MVNETQWYVYIIRTEDGQLYTGITTNIQRRWQEHCGGKSGARYFRAHKPLAVVYLETQPDRSLASKREATIKSLKKFEKQNLILEFENQTPNALRSVITTLSNPLT